MLPEEDLEVAVSWMGGHFLGSGRTLWRMLPFVVLWSIWRERNDIIFKDDFSLLSVLIDRITLRIAK